MLPNKTKRTLADNLRICSGGTDTQSFRQRIAKKSGGSVAERTVGNMMSGTGNPTLESIEAVANAVGVSVPDLLSENLGRPNAAGTVAALEAEAVRWHSSPRAEKIIQRLISLDAANKTPNALFALLENALDLIQPVAGKDDYSSLNDLGDRN